MILGPTGGGRKRLGVGGAVTGGVGGARMDALLAPVRILAGFVVGGALTPLAFAIAWLHWWPHTIYGLVEVALLLAGVSLIGAAVGTGLVALRPIRRWWHLLLVVAVLGTASVDPAVRFRSALEVDCLYGTARTEPPCVPGFDWAPIFLTTVAAGLLTGLGLGSLGVRSRGAPGGQDDSGAGGQEDREGGVDGRPSIRGP